MKIVKITFLSEEIYEGFYLIKGKKFLCIVFSSYEAYEMNEVIPFIITDEYEIMVSDEEIGIYSLDNNDYSYFIVGILKKFNINNSGYYVETDDFRFKISEKNLPGDIKIGEKVEFKTGLMSLPVKN